MSAHSTDTVVQPALTDSFRTQQASLCSVLPRSPSVFFLMVSILP